MPKSVSYSAGAIIFFSGDRNENIYIVLSGLISCKTVDIETGEMVTESLRPGEFLGVKSAMAHAPQLFTASAVVDSSLISLSVHEFEKMFSPKKDITEKMLREFSKNLREIHHRMQKALHNDVVNIPRDAGMLMVAKAFFDDNEYQSCISELERLLTLNPDPGADNKKAIANLLADSKKRMASLGADRNADSSSAEEQKDSSLEQFSAPIFQRFTKEFKKGEVIVSEYEIGETFYLIKSGEVQIVKCITGRNKNLDVLKKGEFFGEMSIIDKSQRSATCVAKTNVSVLEFNKENFGTLVLGNPHLVMSLLKLFCKRICDQQRKLKNFLIKDLQIRVCDVFLMFDENFTSAQDAQLMGPRRTFNLTVSDVAHWGGISFSSAQEELGKLLEKNKIEVFNDYINVMNIHDIRRTVDAYYNTL